VALNDTMGHYHHFRLSCANTTLDCKAIQFSSIDHTNLWDASSDDNNRIITLFEDRPITEIKIKMIQERVFEVLDDIKPEVVILSGWDATPSLLALLWAIRNGRPTVIISESQEHDFKRNFFKELLKKLLLKLIDVAFVGGINQRSYLVKLGFKNENIFEGCDVVDNSFFMEDSTESEIANLKLPKKYFLTSCRFVQKKNLKLLIKSFSLLSSEYSDWSLVLAGDGPLRDALEMLVLENNMSDRVHFTGYLGSKEMKHVYAGASCFVLPSTTEQWGLVVNEALATGIPVLCSENVGSAPNLLSELHVGYMFDPMSSSDLLQKMIKIIQELKNTDFKFNARKVVSEWGQEKYSNNIHSASVLALEIYKKKNYVQEYLLKLFIYISK
jgi:glycosyltransferase involved in cell wall biosynthesis